ncbi:AcrR family transcriptional regulator [Crossiella equi]|uniref:AcrR family transcriptional regulator n=1 Tax=Crossiella equi TaxID=130796 RepID=A0ABS5AQ38_9PSEU|nr:TetR/AcrR family transcriptional regulator [Crossiella equi]MBP2478676.1 AcrR family transcriptional regulator [Crossiella equi]
MTADLTGTTGEAPLRADARRNRDQIISAAKTIFASDGPDVPMEDIARLAGVGVGTLYRRFPDREALIRAVARDNFASALAHARASEAEEPTGWQALVRLLGHSEELELSVRLAMLSPGAWVVIKHDPVTEELRRELLEVLDRVLRAGQAEGTLRPDVGAGDVAILFIMLLRRPREHATDTGRVAARRALAIMLDGLRVRPDPTELPGHPMQTSDLRPER